MITMNDKEFTELVWQKGGELYRDMPWREDTRPYYVLVSELMLQQTQVDRVMPKFQAFIDTFPDEKTLAKSDLAGVLRQWQGLGYNRRAKFLHEAVKAIILQGQFPSTYEELIKLSGVGKNTAGAILVYSFNQPSIFVETNIRTVYIHHFFADNFEVSDKEIIKKLEETLDREHPREFYWALMDYGSYLKRSGIKNVAQSKHYKKQTPLAGSVREIRGKIIAELAVGEKSKIQLTTIIDVDGRFQQALDGLLRDGLVSQTNGIFHLTK